MLKPRRTLVGIAVVVALAGCSGPPTSIADKTYAGGPIGFEGTVNGPPDATWIPGKLYFAIITYSSASCPPVPVELVAAPPSELTITFVPSPATPCTGGLEPTTHQFLLPKGMERDRPIEVHLIYDFTAPVEYDVVLDYP